VWLIGWLCGCSHTTTLLTTHRRILTDYFNKRNFSKHKLMRSPDDGVTALKHVGAVLMYRIFRPITRTLSIQKGSEIVKNEHARYTLERFPTDNAHVICTKKGIGKYGIMY